MKDQIIKRFRVFAWSDFVIILAGTILAIILRLSLLMYKSTDFHLFLKEWIRAIQDLGFTAIVTLQYDYTPTYLYLLYLVSSLFPKLAPVVILKFPSIVFDLISAYTVFRILRLKYPTGPAPVFAYFAVLFAPTVVLNSAFWGQSDSIYTAFLLICIYFLLTDRGAYAGLAFGAAFAMKLQAVFLAPLLLALALKGRFAWKNFLWIPLVYLILMIPAWIAGRPLSDLILIYFKQTQSYPALTLSAPSMYAWLPESMFSEFYRAGMIWGVSLVLLYLLIVLKSSVSLAQSLILKLGMLSLVLVPFILPKMHERYYYPADVLSIAFGFFFPEFFVLPIVMNLISFFAYQPFLLGRQVFPLEILALGILGVLVFLTYDVIKRLYR